jgi:predicted ATPase
MKISLSNFKSIKRLNEFPIKPMTILSGTNSTGKSSLIQFLLLIKQTLELDSSNYQLALNGDYYEVREFKDIIQGKDYKNDLKAEFIFEKPELISLPSRIELFDSLNYSCRVEFAYGTVKDEPYISEFTIRYLVEEDQKTEGQFVTFSSKYGLKDNFSIQTNNEFFVKKIWKTKAKVQKINYSAIYPVSYEINEVSTGQSPTGEELKDEKLVRYFSNLDSVKDKINSYFQQISYIGPLRERPKDIYNIKGRHKSVGSDGEYVAEILETYKNDPVQMFKPTFSDDGVSYSLENSTLIKSVSFWMCDIFKLGKEIRSTKSDDTYSIIIINNSKLHTTVKHVGFGISQVLPIIVEGLILTPGSTLVLEQPEIHLHPKLQSLLFDFLRSLMLKGISIIIETHSDDFITRMRRRVAEDPSNSLATDINLTFIESINDEILFRTIVVDDIGTLEYFPADFMEQSNIETKAILKAQLKRRRQPN